MSHNRHSRFIYYIIIFVSRAVEHNGILSLMFLLYYYKYSELLLMLSSDDVEWCVYHNYH